MTDPWFGPELTDAGRDFFAVYDAHYDEIQAATLEVARSHPEFAPVVRAMGPELIEAQGRESRERLRRAFDGDWQSYEQDLRMQGTAYAQMGISFRGWRDIVSDYTRVLLPRLFETFAGEPARLMAAVLAMHHFLDRAMAVLAEAYLEAKQALIHARERDLAVTLDSIGDAVIATDRDGRVARMNPVAERLTGWTRADATGRALEEVFVIESESDGARVESPVARVLSEGIVVGLGNHTALVTRDGRRVPIADSAAPIRTDAGELLGVVLVFRDVSLERAGERALERSEARKTAMMMSALDSIIFMDHEGRITDFNPAAERTFGYSRDEALGKLLAELIVPERLRDAHESGLQRYLAGGPARVIGRRLELPAVRADGSEIVVEIAVVELSTEEQPLFAGFIRDLTAQKAAEGMRLRTLELEAENRRVMEASRLKSEFLANMSHELRTPLNSIIGFAELLHDGEVGPVSAQQREFLGDVLTSGRHLLQLINDVLDLSKVEAGRMEFRPDEVDLVALAAEVTGLVRNMAANRHVAIHTDIAGDVRRVVVDASRIKQILFNYLSNALKFTPDGGQVRIRAHGEGLQAFRLEVEDDGVGIAPEDVGRLFVEFQQLDAGRSKRHQGTGLGLALTRRLAEAMGGTVGVESQPGVRTVFHVVLPRRAAHTHALPSRRRMSRVEPGVPILLVVEDDPDDQDLIVKSLVAAGYGVDTASTVSQALTMCKERAYDAITLDLMLPDGSGLEVLRAIRASGPNRHVPVVVITLVADKYVSGYVVDDVLTKPLDPKTLLDVLRRVRAAPGEGEVLVVDDDAGSLKLMAATLTQLGYTAACFRDGESALEAVMRMQPRAVVLDLIMPGMDGFRFLELFRSRPEHASTPVLVWTVKDLNEDERQALAPVDGFLPKGSAPRATLVEALRQHLALRTTTLEG